MHQQLIFAPMGIMALLTFAVLAQVPVRRAQAVAAGQIKADDYRSDSASTPAILSIATRDYVSLLELPTLFYVASLMFFVTKKVDAIAIGIAWVYVLLRLAHSVVHLTYNKARHRIAPFAVSNFVLMAYWAWFFLS